MFAHCWEETTCSLCIVALGGVMSKTNERVSHRVIALEAGVSQATVCRALKNDPRISEVVRERVRGIAERLGYRPDPQVSKLLTHMRVMREKEFQSVLGFILPPQKYTNPYMREMVRGARARADALGYVVDDFPTGLEKADVRTLNRVLGARGVEGVVFFPRNALELPPEGFDLRRMAAVNCATFTKDFPVHRVRSGHFENMELLLEELRRRGCKRPGLVTWEDFDRRQRWAPRMGYYHFYHDQLCENPAPIFDWHEHGSKVGPAFLAWFRDVKPDLLLVVGPTIAEEIGKILAGAKIRKKVPMLGVGHTPKGLHGIDEKPATIGSVAIDILTSHIVRNENGWPSDVKMMSLQGALR